MNRFKLQLENIHVERFEELCEEFDLRIEAFRERDFWTTITMDCEDESEESRLAEELAHDLQMNN